MTRKIALLLMILLVMATMPVNATAPNPETQHEWDFNEDRRANTTEKQAEREVEHSHEHSLTLTNRTNSLEELDTVRTTRVVSSVASLKEHPPIYIDGDDDFTPENGVVAGSGTPDDPYIIEGWFINATNTDATDAITIKNTRKHFIMRNCTLSSTWYFGSGIRLDNVANGQIYNNTINSDYYGGIFLWKSTSVTINNNTISSQDSVIMIGHSFGNSIRDNVFVGGGLWVYDSYENTVVNNTVNGKPLVYLEGVKDVTVRYVDAGQIIIINSENIELSGLNMAGTGSLIELWNTTKVTIHNNTISSSNSPAVELWLSTNVTVYLNLIDGGVDTYNSNVTWRSPTPVTYEYNGKVFKNYLGNYWSDYTGTDTDDDGIGDSPYVIDDNNADEYPLTAPPSNYRIIRVKGDVDGDDKVTAVDALLYLKFALGLDVSPYYIDPVSDDLTGDGKITVADALKALRVAVGLEPP